MPRPIARIYAPLEEHRASCGAAGEWRVTLPFAAIEALTGRPLPATARQPRGHRGWWRGHARSPHAWYDWLRRSWRLAAVDRATETVTFARPAGAG